MRIKSSKADAQALAGERDGPTGVRRDMLLKEYGEVCGTFRMLTDIRFKLLAFLPLSASAAAAVLWRTAPNETALAFSAFGFSATLGLVTYNARNDQLYDTLVGRAASIERLLDDPDGAFSNRPQPWFSLGAGKIRWRVDHRTSVATVYYSTLALWLFEVSNSTTYSLYADFKWGTAPEWAPLAAISLAVVLTMLGASLVKARKTKRQDDLRIKARSAVKEVKDRDFTDIAQNEEALDLLAELSGYGSSMVRSRVKFLADHPGDEADRLIGRRRDAIWHAAQLVAYVADFTPEWVYDCATRRRR